MELLQYGTKPLIISLWLIHGRGGDAIAPVPVKKPWRIKVNWKQIKAMI